MNRFRICLPSRGRNSVAGLATSCLVAAATLTGCGSGQVAQTSVQEPAINGASGAVGKIMLRNVRIQAYQPGDFVRPPQTVELLLVVINQSPEDPDRLVRITSESTSDRVPATLTGDLTLKPGGTLFVGTDPGQNIKALDAVEAATAAKATVTLAHPISNGLTYKFTFEFQNAGSVDILVPIAAGRPAPSEQQPSPAPRR